MVSKKMIQFLFTNFLLGVNKNQLRKISDHIPKFFLNRAAPKFMLENKVPSDLF